MLFFFLPYIAMQVTWKETLAYSHTPHSKTAVQVSHMAEVHLSWPGNMGFFLNSGKKEFHSCLFWKMDCQDKSEKVFLFARKFLGLMLKVMGLE